MAKLLVRFGVTIDMNPEDLFLFNSSLPEHGQDGRGSLNLSGRGLANFRGRNIGNGYISYAILKIAFRCPVKAAHLPNAWEESGSPSRSLIRSIERVPISFL